MGTNRSEKDFIDNYINRSQNNLLFKSDDEGAGRENIERAMRDYKDQKLMRGQSFDDVKKKKTKVEYKSDSFFSDNDSKNKKSGKLFEVTDVAKEIMISRKHGQPTKRKLVAPGQPDHTGKIRDEKHLQPDDFQRIISMQREISIDFNESLRNSSYDKISKQHSIDKVERGESDRAEVIHAGHR